MPHTPKDRALEHIINQLPDGILDRRNRVRATPLLRRRDDELGHIPPTRSETVLISAITTGMTGDYGLVFP
jgi:hypothetical protein